jgi:hypothetical protein
MSHNLWMRSLKTSGSGFVIPESWRLSACAADITFLRSWLVSDSKLATQKQSGNFNWNFLVGLSVALVVSVGFWAGIGMAIASWK